MTDESHSLKFSKEEAMTQGRKTSRKINLTDEQRTKLECWLRSTTMKAGHVRRAKMILMFADGKSITEISTRTGVIRKVVYKWIDRFNAQGIESLKDKAGRGRKPVFSLDSNNAGNFYSVSAS
jgi:hypothetical protein